MRDVIILVLLYFGILTWNYQPYMDVINGARLQYLQSVVHTAISEAKIKGYFTSTDLQTIQQNVAQALGYPTGNVFVSGTTTPTTRGTPIELTVSVPTRINLFSLSPSTNHAMLTAHESADSEALD
ncbi:MAG: hypothetical protein K6T81_12645 [Alicyclobacillus macrosporangiidus]|uniref:hypothetical protein n=1 Tax=Alicyclobacillus macrosporangiidus TaxID=392015 RepID=UPI0026EFA499|nr:hypothetical protein [Alicyclobacillus macrosporangiidus]MCL6599572.1 hypothetical protein [Alicyclobacillus macrosporangiidus]